MLKLVKLKINKIKNKQEIVNIDRNQLLISDHKTDHIEGIEESLKKVNNYQIIENREIIIGVILIKDRQIIEIFRTLIIRISNSSSKNI